EIARRQRRNAIFLAASVAFAVVAMVFVLVPRPVQPRAGEAAGAPPKTVAAPSLSGAPAASPVRVVAAQPTRHRRHHRTKTPPPIAIASSERQPITIELQTANPDVRIIWIAGQETK
ncbi:MAG TPA: hypothetical protein VHU41_12250, partial [Thermoanaerobaculia bacterium]|nr:hypothetical protein [Thermoanaerobaculia bacterium]